MQEVITQIKTLFSNLNMDAWVYEVFGVVVVVLIAALMVRRVINKLDAKARKTENPWDDALVNALHRRVRYIILVLGLSYAAEIAGRQSEAAIFDSIDTIRYVLIVMIFAWGMIAFVVGFEEAIIRRGLAKGEKVDQTTIQAIGRLVRTAILITASLVILQTLGFSISGVLAFGGVGGIAVGFAAKDLLANFFGGFMIYLDRPFSVGDWIRSPDREIEGTVEKIGWRLTTIRTFDKRPLYVPNAIFTTIAVENPSRMSHRRIYETIGLRYVDIPQIEKIVQEVKEMLNTHEEIDTSQTMIVNFNAFNDSSVDIMVYTFTKTTSWIRYHQVKENVLLKISNIIESNGAEIAFPTSTMLLESMANKSASLTE